MIPKRSRGRFFRHAAQHASLALALVFLAGGVAHGSSYSLGTQDFTDGTHPNGVAGFEAGQSPGEPAPFGKFNGNDYGTPFSASWTFFYAPETVGSASVTLGLYDHDSAAPGSQVGSFTLDGIDLTILLNDLFESRGGTQTEYDVYTLLLPETTFSALSDGRATFSLTLAGPGLQSPSGTTVSNGAGLDFSRIDLNGSGPAPVPEPSSFALLAVGAAGLAGMRRKRR